MANRLTGKPIVVLVFAVSRLVIVSCDQRDSTLAEVNVRYAIEAQRAASQGISFYRLHEENRRLEDPSSLAVERVVFRRIYERDLPFTMITSFGVLIGGVGVIKFFWGLIPRPVPVPIAAQIYILGTEIPVYRLVIVAIAALVYVGIWLFLNRTIIGKAIRAGTEDVEHVEGLGINVYRLFTITFVIAGGLSGLAGGLHAPLIMVDPQMGLEVLAFAFMVVIIGGLGSIKGTLVSSILVGQVISIGSLIYAPLAQMAPFAIMLLILLIRPTGLFGSPMLKR